MFPVEIKLLYIVILALALTLGLISKKKVGKIIAGMIFFPVVLLVAWNMIQAILMQFPPIERILIIIGGVSIFIIILLVGTRFGREVLASFLADMLYDMFKGFWRMLSGIVIGMLRLFRRM